MAKENYISKDQLTQIMQSGIGVATKTITTNNISVMSQDFINASKYNLANSIITSDITTSNDNTLVKNMLTKKMSGIEALPYQFMENVDRRITGTEMGRKYTEKIVSRLPLLFLTPCKQVFMPDATDEDKNILISMLTGTAEASAAELLENDGRYYSVDYDYTEYYKYLNCMLSAVAAFLGIYEETININGKSSKIGTYAWQNEMNEDFKTFFGAEENLVFYLDGLSSISESFSNSTTDSSLASQINGFADTSNEIRFLFGDKGGALGNIIDTATNATSSIMSSLSSVIGNLGGGIIESLADKGVNTVLNGGKIIFPKLWSDSSYDRSYNLSIKLRSPDHDSLSIYLNILKPYCRLLALVLPRLMQSEDGTNINSNGYRSPFLVKAYCKGLFNIDMGMITSMSVTKGAECAWNDDGLPTQIDIDLQIEDLYSTLAMSGFGTNDSKGLFKIDGLSSIINNTAYMDYLANMAGLNVGQMAMGKKVKLYYYLTRTDLSQIDSRIFTRFDQSISSIMRKIYNDV